MSRTWSEIISHSFPQESSAFSETGTHLSPETARFAKLVAKLEAATVDLAAARILVHEQAEKSSTTAHEMRTPLNAVIGYAQLIEMRSDEPATKEDARRILKAGNHLLSLINELLVVSKAEQNRLRQPVVAVDLAYVISEAIELVQPIANRLGVVMRVVESGFQDVQVMANQRQLFQVVLNLLSNAVKYNRRDGQVELRSVPSANGLQRIEFRDTGVGISEEDQQLLFHPFQRIGNRLEEGSGLGLAISRGFMELMGGSLGLSRSDSRGSSFYIEIPRLDSGRP